MQIRLIEVFICATIVCILGVLLRPHSVAVADGHFSLTIYPSANEQLPAELLIAYCWGQAEKELAEAQGAASTEISFRPPNQTAAGNVNIVLPYSWKTENGQEKWRHEPKFIVIQYEADGQTLVKSFAIPEGRGDRELRVEL